ncbi:MAG: hypothetical protein F6K58_06515 [Symploca sp. SIO2E9]|nr:hypothetical protein [Symploca sp. SIO2E9]
MSNHPNSDPPPPQGSSLDRDEWIAILVAFATIGYIFYWAIGRKTDLFSFGDLELISEETTSAPERKPSGVDLLLSPDATVSPRPGLGVLPLPDARVTSKPTPRELLPPRINARPRPNAVVLPSPEVAVSPSPELEASPSPDVVVSPSPELEASPSPDVAVSPSPELEASPSPEVAVSPSPELEASPSPEVAVSPSPELEASPSPDVAVSPSPELEASPSPDVAVSPSPALEASPSPDVAVSPSPALEASPSETTPSTPLQQTPAAPVEFSDVPEDDWARLFIRTLAQQGIIGGYPGGTFKPNEPVTRAQLAAQLEKLFVEQQERREAIDFEDITSEDYWANEEIQGAYKKGFLSGYPGDVFKPDQQVPRLQVLVALVSGLNLEQSSLAEQALETYKDKEQIPDWAIPKVAAAVQGGLIANDPNQELLRPNQPATRREVAAMMYQALVKSGKIDSSSSPELVLP